jgi:hypothetical protein
MQEFYLLCWFGGRFGVPQKGSEDGLCNVQHFAGGLFHQIKVRQQIGREDSIQAVRMRRLEGFLYEAATNL